MYASFMKTTVNPWDFVSKLGISLESVDFKETYSHLSDLNRKHRITKDHVPRKVIPDIVGTEFMNSVCYTM